MLFSVARIKIDKLLCHQVLSKKPDCNARMPILQVISAECHLFTFDFEYRCRQVFIVKYREPELFFTSADEDLALSCGCLAFVEYRFSYFLLEYYSSSSFLSSPIILFSFSQDSLTLSLIPSFSPSISIMFFTSALICLSSVCLLARVS